MDELVPTVTEEQALELLELGFRHLDVRPDTLRDLEALGASLPQDEPVVIRAETVALSRRATAVLGRLGVDAVDAGTLAVAPAPRLVA